MRTRRQVLAALLLSPFLEASRRAAHAEAAPVRVPHAAEDEALADWIASQRALSLRHLLQNISSTQAAERSVESIHIAADRSGIARSEAEKGRLRFSGDRVIQKIVPLPGSIAAAAMGKPTEPDYFFHWVRDSALIMRALMTYAAAAPAEQRVVCEHCFADFLRFSRALQRSSSPECLGEVRYNLDGTQDILQWSRPQFDGAALRALTLMHCESRGLEPPADESAATLRDVLQADLDYIALNWTREGFDLWEEYKGHDFHARVVQLAAMHPGGRRARREGDVERADRYRLAEAGLRAASREHWLPAQGYYGFFAGPRTYWDGTQRAKPGENFDAAVALAALHGRLPGERYSLLDDRILACMTRAEDLFAPLYRVNRERQAGEGVLYGRYVGDTYYGGNPLVFLTLEFAESYYALARLLARRVALPVTPLNHVFIERALRRAGLFEPPREGANAIGGALQRRAMLRGLRLRGDDILRAVRRLTPPSGELPEQYDKESGASASCPNLSWSHAAFLAAAEARAAVTAAS